MGSETRSALPAIWRARANALLANWTTYHAGLAEAYGQAAKDLEASEDAVSARLQRIVMILQSGPLNDCEQVLQAVTKELVELCA